MAPSPQQIATGKLTLARRLAKLPAIPLMRLLIWGSAVTGLAVRVMEQIGRRRKRRNVFGRFPVARVRPKCLIGFPVELAFLDPVQASLIGVSPAPALPRIVQAASQLYASAVGIYAVGMVLRKSRNRKECNNRHEGASYARRKRFVSRHCTHPSVWQPSAIGRSSPEAQSKFGW